MVKMVLAATNCYTMYKFIERMVRELGNQQVHEL